jgi:hypothetical protein
MKADIMQQEKGETAMYYALFSDCNRGTGPFPAWGRDPKARRLRQGGKRGDIDVVDRTAAGQYYAKLLARRRYGRMAKAGYVQPDGQPHGRQGCFYSVHIYKYNTNDRYLGEQIGFLVVDEE